MKLTNSLLVRWLQRDVFIFKLVEISFSVPPVIIQLEGATAVKWVNR